MPTISDVMREADEIIEQRLSEGQEKTASAKFSDEDIFKLAEEVRSEPKQEVSEEPALNTVLEKVAHALAVADTVVNLDVLIKAANFAEQARAAGKSDEEIDAYLQKHAAGKLKSVLKMMKWPAVAGTAGTAGVVGGMAKGKEEGKEKGYAQALEDVNRAFTDYMQ